MTAMHESNRSLRSGWIALGLLCALTPSIEAQSEGTIGMPLPLDVAVSLRGHNGRSPINLSPNGEWLAHTIEGIERIPRDSTSRRYSATGFPFAEGDARMEATLSNVRTGEVIRLGSAQAASWAPVWSPDGRRVAFYSDEGGSAGLWIWDRSTGRSTRIPDVIVRPFFGFETVQWAADGRRLIVKALPVGITVAQANGLEEARPGQARRFPEAGPDEPSVSVRRVDPEAARAEPADSAPSPGGAERIIGDMRWAEVDLVMVDVTDHSVTRLAERVAIRAYALSPDQRHVAYTVSTGFIENTQQSTHDLIVHDLASGARTTLGTELRLGYGIEWSWSPDSRAIAMISSGQLGSGEIVVVSIGDALVRTLASDDVPGFDPGEGEYPPLWSHDARQVFAVGDGELWRIDVGSGQAAAVGRIPGWRIRSAVWQTGDPEIWLTDRGRTAWVVARRDDGAQDGIFAVDLQSGETRAVLSEPKTYYAVFNLTASERTGEIAFVSTGQQHLAETWLLDVNGGEVRQASRINEALGGFALGSTRILEWSTADGQALRGALLLPPTYRAGMRVPLVVWVYGGAMGSNSVNRFGLTGMNPTFNMHILATRGYAVLYPDAPVRPGMPMADLLRTVMPGVDNAIEQGFADPDRLAVMGQSYGSFSTLALITQTTRFKAAVITAAVLHPDLVADYLGSTGYYEQGQGNMGGSVWEFPDRYVENSPIYRFDRIETPLLIGQGERDGDLVPAEAIFAALQRLEKPVEYRLYAGEGHVITRRPNVLDFW
jgi:dipeptidyl aminopeptidase/acylaminoacyl peptidase